MNLEKVLLEDDTEYIVISEEKINENNYVFLVDSSNKEQFAVRKVIDDNLIGLDDEQELNDVMQYYIKKKYEELKDE